MRCRVVAIVSVFNEADILQESLEHLFAHEVEAYVIDNGSNDGSRDVADKLIGHGVVAAETFQPTDREFRWKDILNRKSAVAASLDADWFIHHDADEFRDSPWPGLTLADAIAAVDEAGYNAIDFALLNFWPITDWPSPELGQVQRTLTHFGRGEPFNERQIRCWKRQLEPVDLASSGGHEARFPNRNVFPIRFVLRHYPIRSVEHGRRKVFEERLPRFSAEERAIGWHVQYDDLRTLPVFSRNETSLMKFEPDDARLMLALDDARRIGLERQERDHERESSRRERDSLEQSLNALSQRLTEAGREQEVLAGERDALAGRLAGEYQRSDAQRATIQSLSHDLTSVRAERDRLGKDVDHVLRELHSVYASRTWRWTAFLRQVCSWAASLVRLRR
jgi:hypothetical protein